MSMLVLILILLAGGLLAWQAERIHPNLPRWAALGVVVVSLVFLLSSLPAAANPVADRPPGWPLDDAPQAGLDTPFRHSP